MLKEMTLFQCTVYHQLVTGLFLRIFPSQIFGLNLSYYLCEPAVRKQKERHSAV